MLDKKRIAQHFSRSAKTYDQYALLQHKVVDEILMRISSLPLETGPKQILDIGCGTGILAAELAKKYPEALVIGCDLAPGMVEFAQVKHRQPNLSYELADAESLPYTNGQFDLVLSSSTLQWTALENALKQILRVLASKSNFIFSTFGPLTLKELKETFLALKDGKRTPVNEFQNIVSVENILKSTGFSSVKLSTMIFTQKYDTVKDVLWSLKQTGAQYAGNGGDVGLGGKERLEKVLKYYSERYGNTATYEIIYGAAQKD
jgi:malonyl-CoA O-methyltransferase